MLTEEKLLERRPLSNVELPSLIIAIYEAHHRRDFGLAGRPLLLIRDIQYFLVLRMIVEDFEVLVLKIRPLNFMYWFVVWPPWRPR